MQLSDIIKNEILKKGPISFHDYMEMCLYYPELGYYTSVKDKIGPQGDYYTSSCLSTIFGTLVAEQLTEMWRLLGEGDFTIVEYGAGMGQLCHDILQSLKDDEPFYKKLNYCIIEKSPTMRAKEKAHLVEKVNWIDSINEINGFTGCVLSNELVDNLAVHRVAMGDELMEIFVTYDEGRFTEILMPASDELKGYFEELHVRLPKGYQTEINLEATDWVRNIAGGMGKGYVLTIDYGYPSRDLYHPYRKEGTMVCYNKHRVNYSPYIDIGRQDITTHVNFTALYHWGLKYGLNGCGFTDQAHFLLALGFEDQLKKMQEPDAYRNYQKNQFLKNTLLNDMGRKFKVLIQEKEAPKKKLKGLQLSA